RGASAAITRGVKALDTSRRSRVWSGGSRDRNDAARAVKGEGEVGGGDSSDRPRSLLARGSRRILEQSSCRPTTTNAPPASGNGDASRSPARTGYGSGTTVGLASSVSAGRPWAIRHAPGAATAGVGTPTGYGYGSSAAQAWAIGVSRSASSSVAAAPSRAQGRAAARSVASSTA